MMHDLPQGGDAWHPLGCRCAQCDQPGPGDAAAGLPVGWTLGLLVAGIATAFAIDFVIDRLADGPGVFALFIR
ncbi:hypothetical protein BH10PSE14_BH10PSE14_04640 [soil metagenome]